MDRKQWTEAELVAAMAGRGYVVSTRQIERWRKADLMPRPIVRPLGKGHGTASYYPMGSDSYVLEICRLKSTGKGRPLGRLRFELWWLGYAIPLNRVRESLIELVQPIHSMTMGLANRDHSNEILELQQGSERAGVMAHVRQALRGQEYDFPDLIALMIDKANGSPRHFNEPIDHISSDRTFADTLNDVSTFDGEHSSKLKSSVWGGALVEFLPIVIELMRQDPKSVLERIDDERLELARDAARAALHGMVELAVANKRLTTRDMGGLRIARQLKTEIESPQLRAFQVLNNAATALLTMELLRESASTTPILAGGVEALDRLFKAIPELKGSDENAVELTSLTQSQQEDLKARYLDYMQAHPEDRDAIEAWMKLN
jgi:hypothetical protein